MPAAGRIAPKAQMAAAGEPPAGRPNARREAELAEGGMLWWPGG
jgi:hypothetical protein